MSGKHLDCVGIDPDLSGLGKHDFIPADPEAQLYPPRLGPCECPDTYRIMVPEVHHESCPVLEPLWVK